MQAQNLMVKPSKGNAFQGHFGTAFVIGYTAIAIAAILFSAFLAAGWLGQPFLGFFVGNTLVVIEQKSDITDRINTVEKILAPGDRIYAIDGEPVQSIHHLNQILQRRRPGDLIEISALSKAGEARTISVLLSHFSGLDLLSYFVLPYLVGVTILGSGIWILIRRKSDTLGQVYALFAVSAGLAVALFFEVMTTSRMVVLWLFCTALSGASLITLGLIFPDENSYLARQPVIRWLGFLSGLVVFLYALPWQYNLELPYQYVISWRMIQIYAVFGVLFFIGWMVFRTRWTPEPRIREQCRLTLIGAVAGLLPTAVWLIFAITRFKMPFSPLLFAPFLIFPLTLAYNLSRTRDLQTDFIASQAMLYTALTILAATGYGLIITGTALLTNNALNLNNPLSIGAAVFILTFVFLPLRERLQRSINKAFGRDFEPYRIQVQNYSHELTQMMEIEAISKLLRNYLETTLSPSHIHIFLNHPGSEHYTALPDETGVPTSELVFSNDSGLVKVLSSRRAPIYLGNLDSIPAPLIHERSRLALLGSHLFVPLPGRQRLIGWIGLGPLRTGQLYKQQDLNYLETLSDQTALAFERAQAIQDLERRVHQMNVLTRMAQGINVTGTFNDLLELIYAQSSQILPTRDFRIALTDKRSGTLTYVFYLENDERLEERENSPLLEGVGLESEIIRLGRSLMTDDYELECRNRNVLANPKGIYAWIGVPLNTGSETIGVLTLGSRDPSIRYTQEQANLLQAIADQAAGAILKAQLLEEAEQRARQLATLNEVAQSLSSTLELVPLFNQILCSAVDILNCEAGSLLLVDQDTGEYIFEAAAGPVAENLIGTRLPAGTGLVGKAVASKNALIVNDVRRSKDWSVDTDKDTGYKTNDLLVVPMVYRDDVTGVIEVLNRKDGQPFTQDDQDLLSAFASQAAVALENARLFTLTDQTLAERVEELSVLQRIDRELNISLDIDRALRVTLEWAMRQSHADSGLIGILENDRLRIMASQGYTNNELSQFETSGLPLDFPAIQKALETTLPQFIPIGEGNNIHHHTLLADARQQVVIPIRREAQVIGLILIESRTPGASEDEKIGFLTRLADHASVAITNARLYAEVQAANQAKSDFVSFVSHELKTPMTSIRGFTDLLASGVVGPVNENQVNFLNTIRSNVDRMATLVSDLADVSRIEAGRLRLEFSAVPVNEIIDEVVRSTRAQILEKKQTLIVNAPQNLPPMWGDRVRLIQILTNLVSNAYKYTQPEGLIQINAELSENIWTEGSPQVIHVSVKDNGYGINPENQPKIFQKFYRSDDQKIRDAPGTGLGLNITKQLVELQGGSIWFESQFRAGTTFHFTIPIAESA